MNVRAWGGGREGRQGGQDQAGVRKLVGMQHQTHAWGSPGAGVGRDCWCWSGRRRFRTADRQTWMNVRAWGGGGRGVEGARKEQLKVSINTRTFPTSTPSKSA
jgi:hypothetical protein